MKIIYIATSFPEPHKGATIYTDLAEALYEAGHEITVVVSEQAINKKNTTFNKERGFDVLRIVTGNYYDVNLIKKGITTLSIPVILRKGISRFLRNRSFEVVLFESPPVTNSSLVAWVKKKYNCMAYLMLKDIFPQNALDLGFIKKNGLIYRYFLTREKKLYKIADYIGCMSLSNIEYLSEHNPWLDTEKLELFPNTKKITDDYLPKQYIMRKKFGISPHSCVFLFGGNMGKPQYVELLCETVRECKNDRDIFFLFIGRGTDRVKLELAIKKDNITNAIVIENLPRDEYEQITKECNIGLITLDPRFTIPNFPSRILTYMEYSKPVLAATDNVSDIKNLIEEAKCGKWVLSSDSRAFISQIQKMAQSAELELMGKNGRSYLENNFNLSRSIKILERHFHK